MSPSLDSETDRLKNVTELYLFLSDSVGEEIKDVHRLCYVFPNWYKYNKIKLIEIRNGK